MVSDQVSSQSESDYALAMISFPTDEKWDSSDNIFTYYFYKQPTVKGITAYIVCKLRFKLMILVDCSELSTKLLELMLWIVNSKAV